MTTWEHFTGASATSGLPTQPGTATSPTYSTPASTAEADALQPSSRPQPDTSDIAEWLRSDAAAPYAGRWVLLSADFQVVDSDTSPSALLERHPDVAAPVVVYVDRRAEGLAV